MHDGALLGGKYRLLREIGVGGMGTVYEGEHIEIHRKVAVKLLHSEFAQNADAVGRFRREAQIAGSLGHDNICDVLDVGVTPEGAHFLVMPLLRGTSLAHLLGESGPMHPSRALDIVAQVLGALEAAHAAGVVHRDLKPENVFITRVGDREDFVKVLDFGISKVVSTGGALPSSMTRTGTVMGTPYYMSPEQARGQKDQDHRVDVYATGVMLYEMVTGKRPYDGDTFNELIIKIVTEPYQSPRTLRDGLHPRVEAIIDRAMARDREGRYPDASTMRADVVAVRAGLSDAIPGTRAMLPLSATSAKTATGAQPASTQRRDPPPRSRKGILVAAGAACLLLAGGAAVFAFSGASQPTPPPVTATPVAIPFPTTTAPIPTAAPATSAPLPESAVTGLEPPAPESAEPETSAPSRTTRRSRVASSGTTAATSAPATSAPATSAPERARLGTNSRIITGRSGTKVLTNNE